jgi:hypothetical protein
MTQSLSDDKKLTVLFRVEPGCLGPDGATNIEAFCQYAQQNVTDIDAGFVIWQIIPRFDKSLPELEYQVNQKKLNHHQAVKYLNVFDECLDDFEMHLNDRLGQLIEAYLSR